MLQKQLSGISRDLVVAYGASEQAIAEAKDLMAKNDQTAAEIVAQKTEVGDSTWSGMRQRIYELELEEQRASAVYTEDHPHLVRVRKQLEGAHKILAGQESQRVQLNTTPNPIKIDLGNQLQQQQTTIAGLTSAIKEKEKRVAEMQLEIDSMLEHERHLMKVDRDIRLMEDNLIALEEKLEEARVLDDLHSEKISAINVFQPATFVERAVRPEKKTLAAGFLFLGLTTGLFLSVLRQGSSTTLRTTEDVESQLGCPVVTTIPRLSRMKSPYLKDRRLYRQKCQAVIADVLLSRRHPSRSRGRSLGIISVEAGAGASTLAMNLAITSSDECRIKTVLVDADFHRRSISKMFGLNGAPGLVELVGGIASHDECLQTVKDSRVELVASAADSCDEILSGSAPEIIQALQAYVHDCDLLIVDLPAADQPDQAVALAQHLDSVLVVVESEKTETAPAERLLRRLLASDTEVVGVVLNKTQSYLPKIVRSFVAPQV
jgi:succinoglycan biosynthesis transport protein ExoP